MTAEQALSTAHRLSARSAGKLSLMLSTRKLSQKKIDQIISDLRKAADELERI